MGPEGFEPSAKGLVEGLEFALALDMKKKAAMAEFSSKAKANAERIAKSLAVVRHAQTEGEVPCRVSRNYLTGQVSVMREDTQEVIESRPLTAEEKQRNLPFEGPTDGDGA